jgi:peptidyl-prolyl cis-trans isomerase C
MTTSIRSPVLSILALLLLVASYAQGFAPTSASPRSSLQQLQMGLFDGITKAFSNSEYGPPAEAVKATARHILVPSQNEALMVMKMIASGDETFESCARDYSTCPSSSNKGGSLGSFSPGTMVPEFDKVIFNPDTKVGQIVGPVLTAFGHHVIVVDKRKGGGDWY